MNNTPVTPKSTRSTGPRPGTPGTPGSKKKHRKPTPLALQPAPNISNVVTAVEFNENLDSFENDMSVMEARVEHLEGHMDTMDPAYQASRPGVINRIPIKLLHRSAKMPVVAKSGDAAMDLFVSREITIPAKCTDRVVAGGLILDGSIGLNVAEKGIPAVLNRGLVRTDIALAIPVGYYGRVAPRSGLSNKGFDVGAGVIDSGYRGEIKVLMINNSTEDRTFHVGNKFAQLILTKIMDRPILEKVEDLPSSERGEGGFGSTGST